MYHLAKSHKNTDILIFGFPFFIKKKKKKRVTLAIFFLKIDFRLKVILPHFSIT